MRCGSVRSGTASAAATASATAIAPGRREVHDFRAPLTARIRAEEPRRAVRDRPARRPGRGAFRDRAWRSAARDSPGCVKLSASSSAYRSLRSAVVRAAAASSRRGRSSRTRRAPSGRRAPHRAARRAPPTRAAPASGGAGCATRSPIQAPASASDRDQRRDDDDARNEQRTEPIVEDRGSQRRRGRAPDARRSPARARPRGPQTARAPRSPRGWRTARGRRARRPRARSPSTPPEAIASGRAAADRAGRATDRRPPRAARRHRPPRTCAPTAPMPRPATRSSRTPASESARSTPAWYAPAVPVPARTRAVRCRGEYGAERAEDASPVMVLLVGVVVNRGQLQNLEGTHAGRRRDHDLVAYFLADEGAANRRGRRDPALLSVRIFRHHQLIGQQIRLSIREDRASTRTRPLPCGSSSRLMSEISPTRRLSMPMRACRKTWRSLAALYSAFSRRSPSSRARWISFGQLGLQLPLELLNLVLESLQHLRLHRSPGSCRPASRVPRDRSAGPRC